MTSSPVTSVTVSSTGDLVLGVHAWVDCVLVRVRGLSEGMRGVLGFFPPCCVLTLCFVCLPLPSPMLPCMWFWCVCVCILLRVCGFARACVWVCSCMCLTCLSAYQGEGITMPTTPIGTTKVIMHTYNMLCVCICIYIYIYIYVYVYV